MAYELNGQTYFRTPWDHSKSCDYCKAQGLPSCKHHRGGKTALKRKVRKQQPEQV